MMIPLPPSPTSSTSVETYNCITIYLAVILIHTVVAMMTAFVIVTHLPALHSIIDQLSRAKQRLKINLNRHLYHLIVKKTTTPGSIKSLLLKLLQIITVMIQFVSYRSTKKMFFLVTSHTMILSMGYSNYRDILIRKNKFPVRLSGINAGDVDVNAETIIFDDCALRIFSVDFVLGCITQWIQCLLLGYHLAMAPSSVESQMCLHALFLWLFVETMKEDDDQLTATINSIMSTITGVLDWLEAVDSVNIVTLLRYSVNARVSLSDVCHVIVTSELGIFVLSMYLLYVIHVVTGIRTFLLLATLIFSLRTTLTHYQRYQWHLKLMCFDAKSMLLSWASQSLLRLLCRIAKGMRDFILCENLDLSKYDGFPPKSTPIRTVEEDTHDDEEKEEEEEEEEDDYEDDYDDEDEDDDDDDGEDDYDDEDDEDYDDDDDEGSSMSSSSIDRQLEEVLTSDMEEELPQEMEQASPDPAKEMEQYSVVGRLSSSTTTVHGDIAPEQSTTVKGLSTCVRDDVATEDHDATNVDEDDWLMI